VNWPNRHSAENLYAGDDAGCAVANCGNLIPKDWGNALAGKVFPAHIVKFGDFEADLSSGYVRSAGLEIRIQAKPLEILRLLLTAQGRTVTREELRLALWPDNTFVDFEHGLNTAVKKLRKALGDSAEHPKLIQTIPKVGYRFVGTIEWVPDSPAVKEIVTTIAGAVPDGGAAAQFNHGKQRMSWRVTVLSGSLLIIAAFAIFRHHLPRPLLLIRLTQQGPICCG
jgi:DNA-binding winged helix-turn-helix (wHTH) protein